VYETTPCEHITKYIYHSTPPRCEINVVNISYIIHGKVKCRQCSVKDKRKKKLTFEYMVDDGHGLVIFARHACRIIAPFRDEPCSQNTPNRENFYGDTVDGQSCKSVLSKNRVPANLSVYNNIVLIYGRNVIVTGGNGVPAERRI